MPSLPLSFVFALLLLSQAASASGLFERTELQYFLLPDYCKAHAYAHQANQNASWRASFPMSTAEIESWRKRIGPDWRHMHHFCYGLTYLLASEPNYRRAVGEINYTRSRSTPSSFLWLELTIHYARAVEGSGRRQEAIELLSELVPMQPKNETLYATLAQTLHRAGKTEEAIAVLETGLKQASKKGPILFWLARYQYDVGNISRAAELTLAAEQAGMKMDSLRERLGPAMNRADPTAGN